MDLLNSGSRHRRLQVQLHGILFVGVVLAQLQAQAQVILKQAVLGTELARTTQAVSNHSEQSQSAGAKVALTLLLLLLLLCHQNERNFITLRKLSVVFKTRAVVDQLELRRQRIQSVADEPL